MLNKFRSKFEMNAIVVFDIDGVIRDVGSSYRLALADTVAEFTNGGYRPTAVEIDRLKGEGSWNNDWEASQELIYRYFERQGQARSELNLDYEQIVAYFQTKYRGTDPVNWNGYICNEPILASLEYFNSLTAAGIPWGFFSGATQGSASYILAGRLGLVEPILVAMEDAPGKPDPTGLFMAVVGVTAREENRLGQQHGNIDTFSIIYVGDTVADMRTVVNARKVEVHRNFIAVGVLPPHILAEVSLIDDYREGLVKSGATIVIDNVQELTPELINSLI
jgi:HAD superfamily phosphatase